MARVAVTSCMYLGDAAPFIPVARRLHKGRYDVTFVVVQPQLVDQIWHGRRVAELGVGLPARRVNDIGPAAVRVATDRP